MRKIISVFTILVFLVSLTACATTNPDGSPNAGNSAGLGALIGAAGGAVLGYVVSGDAKGALTGAAIGAAVGGLTGFVIGKEREKTHKNANQIYKEKPQLAQMSAKNDPPKVAFFRPCILDTKTDKEIKTVKNGEWVLLATEYEIDIPKYSDQKEVKVVEYNTLVAANGKKMDLPGLTRTKMRPCKKITAGIEVQIPKDQPPGKYTHVAMIKLGNKEYKKDQHILIAKSNGEVKIYASNKNN